MVQIDGLALKRMISNAAAAIDNDKQTINELNVFPVPDGDTGTNMSLTIMAATGELSKLNSSDIGVVAEVIARAMVRGARQLGRNFAFLPGLFKASEGPQEIDGAILPRLSQAVSNRLTRRS